MGLTREEAKALATSGAYNKSNYELLMKADYYSFIDQIYNYHEAQIKAKDEEIEKLKAEHEIQLNRRIAQSAILRRYNPSRRIVAMLFWEKQYKKRVFETWVKKHIDMPIGTSFRKGMVDEAEALFERAYKILKEQQ